MYVYIYEYNTCHSQPGIVVVILADMCVHIHFVHSWLKQIFTTRGSTLRYAIICLICISILILFISIKSVFIDRELCFTTNTIILLYGYYYDEYILLLFSC